MKSVLRTSRVVMVLLASLTLFGCFEGGSGGILVNQPASSIVLSFDSSNPSTVANGRPQMGYAWLEQNSVITIEWDIERSSSKAKEPFSRQNGRSLETGYNSVNYAGVASAYSGRVEGSYEAEVYYDGVIDGKVWTTINWHFTGILSGTIKDGVWLGGTIKGSWSQTQTFTSSAWPTESLTGSATWTVGGQYKGSS